MTFTDTHRRIVLAVSGLASWASIAFAYYYLEKTLYLTPCNLCMMQRLAFALIGFFFLLDAIFWPQRPVARAHRGVVNACGLQEAADLIDP